MNKLFDLKNQIFKSDSYKFGHYKMMVPGVQNVYSYFESRENTISPKILWFGLQYKLKNIARVTKEHVDEAQYIINHHLGPGIFDRYMWDYIVAKYDGRLPLLIKALPEGSFVPSGMPLLSIEATDYRCGQLVQFVESYLMHSWYPTTVATLSFNCKKDIAQHWIRTCDNLEGLEFVLHDFGYRAVEDDPAAGIGGLGHLVNFRGTDTVQSIPYGMNYYNMSVDHAKSVWAAEHSIMTQLGKSGEEQVFLNVLDRLPDDAFVSFPIDSYCPYNFTSNIIRKNATRIAARKGRVILRPDSTTGRHKEPADQVVWIMSELADIFGYTKNLKGYNELNPKVAVLWGDGLERDGIDKILRKVVDNNFSVKPNVFGMGGGLLQKVNRDNHRFKLAASAQLRDGKWHDMKKETFGKTSRSGRFSVEKINNEFSCMDIGKTTTDMLTKVFHDGYVFGDNFESIVNRADWYFKQEIM